MKKFIIFLLVFILLPSNLIIRCVSEHELIKEEKSVKEKDIIGGWKVLASNLDCEEILLEIDEDGRHTFRSFLHDRPFDIGEWKLTNDKLIIITGRFTNEYSGILLKKNILKFYDNNDEQKFKKIIIGGSHD